MNINLFRSSAAFAVALLLIATLFTGSLHDDSAAAQESDQKTPDAVMAGTISGRVFQDHNSNGLFETGGGTSAQPTAVDSGVACVAVSAYDSAGVLRGTATTAANGTYSLAATGSGPYRVEFTGLPAGFLPSARSASSVSGNSSTTAGSTVHFVADGNTSNVNLAINRPGDHCQENPEICSQLYGVGDATQPEAVFTTPYWAGSTRTTGGLPVADFTSPGMVSLATTDDVGTTFGLAYHRSTRRILVAAYMKKHAKFGPGGPGAIYQIDRNTNAVSEFVNLNTIFGPTTVGADPHNPNNYNTDNGQATWNAVGKIGFGGMTLSDDEQYLFAMNLANRQLYRIPTSGPLNSTTITSVAFPATMPNCNTASEVRPFAVSKYAGSIYVGAVCSRETAGSQISNSLRAYVYRFDPVTMAFITTPVMNFQLNYPRQFTDPGYSAGWRNWRSTYQTISTAHFIYPQPMLTDIDFDRGNMILSLRDRNGDQSGYNSASDPDRPTRLWKGITAGDILRACGNPIDGWSLESNGRCGGIGNAPQNTDQGPGDGEYYYQDNYHPNGNPHDEVGLGGAAQIPGHNVLVATIFDPVYIPNDNIYDAGGFRWFNNSTGAQNRGFLAYAAGDFGKANGIGNVEPLCESAPIEIGNFLWRDSNFNGVQDPDELPVVGATVNLYQGSTLVATAVSNALGEYYFVSGTIIDPTPNDHIGEVLGGLTTDTTYQVRLDNPADHAFGGPLFRLAPTFSFVNTQAGNTVGSDSNAVSVANPAGSPIGIFPVVSVTTGGAGANDHTFDIGFNSIAPTSAPVSIEGRVMTADGKGIRNASVRLENGKGEVVSALTGSFGYFRFEGIAAGQTVIITVGSKRFVFAKATRSVTTDEDLTGIDFVAEVTGKK